MSGDVRARSFGAGAAAYETGRPEYPADAVTWLLEPVLTGEHPLVADVGAGTGKLTRAVLASGADVVAVDPDPKMLATLKRTVPGVPTHEGTAEDLPLDDASVDAVVLGQAWHWVDPVRGSREIGRVLRPGGVLGLVWNFRDPEDELVQRLFDVLPMSPAEELVTGPGPQVAEPFGALDQRDWRWVRPMTRDAFEAMMRSRSFYLTGTPQEQQVADAGLAEVLDDLGLHGAATVDLPYVTRAYRAGRA